MARKVKLTEAQRSYLDAGASPRGVPFIHIKSNVSRQCVRKLEAEGLLAKDYSDRCWRITAAGNAARVATGGKE